MRRVMTWCGAASAAVLGLLGCGAPNPPAAPAAPVDEARGEVPEATPEQPAPAFQYPLARRGDTIDDYHGTKVADPYRWLEDSASEETRAWIAAQNALTFPWLDARSARDLLEQRLTQRWNYERYGLPSKKGGRYFFTKNDGLQPQAVLYWTPSLDAEPRVLLDPNTWSEDGSMSLGSMAVSEDGRHLAYGVKSAGSDWTEWRVRDIDSGMDLPDRLRWVKFSAAAWSPDGKGFYYSRYPEPSEGQDLTAINLGQRLFYHRLGDPQDKDELIYERPDQPKWGFGARVTDDGRYLIVSVWSSGPRNLVYFRPLKKGQRGGPLTPILAEFEGELSFIDNDGPIFWFATNLDAPRRRIVAIDSRRPDRRHWKEVIPQSGDTLRGVDVVGDRFLTTYMHDAYTVARAFDLKGKPLGDIALPGVGSASGFGGRRGDPETFYTYTSFTEPGAIYRYDARQGASTLYRKPQVDFDGDAYETKQVFYTSKDGTRVPMFIVHKKGLALDGNNPTRLTGYGGFGVSRMPYFSMSTSVWLDLGGVFAVPNLRGGGEYGLEWHQAGTKLNKQNVFDDFIAAAEYLIEQGYTRPEKLAIEGGSNGGLLVGAVMIQRPELFGAAIPAVGVMDMLRFHTFTIGWAWVDDYGSAEDPAQFAALRAYSPYHNLTKGTCYPATLVTTADHDDRVVPAHSFKFAAALQYAQGCDKPALIRIQTRAGHGAGKPTAMAIRQVADELAFLVETLGMTLGD